MQNTQSPHGQTLSFGPIPDVDNDSLNPSSFILSAALHRSVSTESSALSNSPHGKKLGSTTRNRETDFFTVDEMAKVIHEELSEHTYSDVSGIVKALFAERKDILNVLAKEPLITVLTTTNDAYRPPFISAFFKGKDVDEVAMGDSASPKQGSSSTDNMKTIANEFSFVISQDDLPTEAGVGADEAAEKEKEEKAKKNDERLLQVWFNHIGEAFDNIARDAKLDASERRYTADHSTTPMTGVTPEKRKPDLVLIPGNSLNPSSNGSWRSVFVVIEFSREKNFQLRLRNEVSQRAALIFHNCPGRRFVPVLVISGRQFMVSMFHRSGVTHSVKYDLVDAELLFYYILAGFFFCSPSTLGYDPNISLDKACVPIEIRYRGEDYLIKETLFVREGIQGRGTVCWIVEHKITGKRFMLKMAWIDKTRELSEDKVYTAANGARLGGMPIMISYEDSLDKGMVDTTERWKPTPGAEHFHVRTYRKILLDGIGKPITHFSSKRELLSAVIDILRAHQQLYFVLGFIHRDISLSNMYLIDKYPTYPPGASTQPPSTHSNIETSPVFTGSPNDTPSRISSSTTPNTISSFARGATSPTPAAQVPQDVFGPDVPNRGMLADFDYVARVSDPSEMEKIDPKLKQLTPEEQRQRLRTGTLPYMAIGVLLGAPDGSDFYHMYQMDIESVIYGLMDICIHFQGPNGSKRDFAVDKLPPIFAGTALSPTEIWTMRELSWVQLGMLKITTWAFLEDWVLPSFHPYFHNIKDMFVELGQKLWPLEIGKPEKMQRINLRDYNRRIRSPATYEDIIGVLEKYRDEVKEPFEENLYESRLSQGLGSLNVSSSSGQSQSRGKSRDSRHSGGTPSKPPKAPKPKT